MARRPPDPARSRLTSDASRRSDCPTARQLPGDLRPRRRALPERVRRHRLGVRAGRSPWRVDRRGARGRAARGPRRRAHPRHPRLRQGQLPGALGRALDDPGLPAPGRRVGARLGDLQGARLRRSGRRRRPRLPIEDQRAVGLGLVALVPGQMLPAAAREMARPPGRRDALSPALPRSGGEPGFAARVRDSQPDRLGDPPLLRGARLPRSRDADDAADRRRGAGAAVRHASQRARHEAVPPHRAGAVPEAAHRRRHGARVRDQPQLPQRRHLDAAQPRVHDARVLPGLRRVPGPDGAHRDARRRGRPQRRRHDRRRVQRREDRAWPDRGAACRCARRRRSEPRSGWARR